MKEQWILMAVGGEYEDYTETIIAICDSLSDAKKSHGFVVGRNTLNRKLWKQAEKKLGKYNDYQLYDIWCEKTFDFADPMNVYPVYYEDFIENPAEYPDTYFPKSS